LIACDMHVCVCLIWRTTSLEKQRIWHSYYAFMSILTSWTYKSEIGLKSYGCIKLQLQLNTLPIYNTISRLWFGNYLISGYETKPTNKTKPLWKSHAQSRGRFEPGLNHIQIVHTVTLLLMRNRRIEHISVTIALYLKAF
jgi:hypothetical protein